MTLCTETAVLGGRIAFKLGNQSIINIWIGMTQCTGSLGSVTMDIDHPVLAVVTVMAGGAKEICFDLAEANMVNDAVREGRLFYMTFSTVNINVRLIVDNIVDQCVVAWV